MKEMNPTDQLNQLKKQYEENLHLQISTISHEVRNPVTLIHAYLQLLAKSHPELVSDNSWTHVMTNMDHLIALLNSLSQYNNSLSVQKSTVYIYPYLLNVADELSPVLEEHQFTLDVKKKSALPPIKIDGTKMRQVLHNLIRNSMEAKKSGGHISISTYFQDLSIVIDVQDNGPGIPSAYLSDLFEPFVSHKKEGTGLGLAIVKNIIHAHNGTIEVASSDENGTCFSIKLPI